MSSSRKSATVCNNSGNAMSPLARPGVRSSVAIVDMCLIGFMGSSNLALNLTPCMNSSQPERGLLKSANIELVPLQDQNRVKLRRYFAKIDGMVSIQL